MLDAARARVHSCVVKSAVGHYVLLSLKICPALLRRYEIAVFVDASVRVVGIGLVHDTASRLSVA